MRDPGLFDLQSRLEQLREFGQALQRLNDFVDWEGFRARLETIRPANPKSNAGRKPYDVILMFKILILQSLYNLSDAQAEFQIKDRFTFMEFLGLTLADPVPDEKTIWLFREQLTRAGLIDPLFEDFQAVLDESGFIAQKGQIIDASIVSAPRQRNSREENQRIKAGEVPESWGDKPAKRRQKDTDARWTKKRNISYFGYKNHVSVDVKNKFVRRFVVTDASVHDSQVCESLLDGDNTNADVFGDSAYFTPTNQALLSAGDYRERMHRKGYRNRPLTESQKASNLNKSRLRARVEHVFGVQSQIAGRLLIRTIGLARAKMKIGLRNLAYNLNRFGLLMARASG